MTNAKFYEDEILKCACEGRHLAVDMHGKIADCNQIDCGDCALQIGDVDGCDARAAEWLQKEHVAPIVEIDWERVPVDTPVYVWASTRTMWRRHFAKYENGRLYCWANGYTSFTAQNPSNVSIWSAAELCRKDDVERYRKW